MANIQYYDVILKPVITEKSMAVMGEKKYTFLVHPEANKTMIKEAVEKMFEGTKVKNVNTMNIGGKKKFLHIPVIADIDNIDIIRNFIVAIFQRMPVPAEKKCDILAESGF